MNTPLRIALFTPTPPPPPCRGCFFRMPFFLGPRPAPAPTRCFFGNSFRSTSLKASQQIQIHPLLKVAAGDDVVAAAPGIDHGVLELRIGIEIGAIHDIVVAAPGVSLQKARTWDEGVSSDFSMTPLKDLFQGKKVVIFGLPGAFTGVCSEQHVQSYQENIDKFKAKGINSVICVAVNDPYTMNAWAEELQAKDAIEFYGDFDGKFHKSLGLDIDLSAALLGLRSHRMARSKL